jgi:hypothetical protein
MANNVNQHIVVLDPTSPPRELRNAMALRQPDIQGQTLGFLWNSKPNGDILFARLEELLRQKYEISGAIYCRKPTASIPATEDVLNELAATANVVVVGLAD